MARVAIVLIVLAGAGQCALAAELQQADATSLIQTSLIPAKGTCIDGLYEGEEALHSIFTSTGSGRWWWDTWGTDNKDGGFVAYNETRLRNKMHLKTIFRSPPFTVTKDTSFYMLGRGGRGPMTQQFGHPYTEDSLNHKPFHGTHHMDPFDHEIKQGGTAKAPGLATGEGFLGLCVQDVETNTWVMSKHFALDMEDAPQAITYDRGELVSLIGKVITVDLVDTMADDGHLHDHDKPWVPATNWDPTPAPNEVPAWAWISMHFFSLEGTCSPVAPYHPSDH